MHSFINELRAEGVTYVAPWMASPPSHTQREESLEGAESSEKGEMCANTEGAIGYHLASTSSDFGSMSLDQIDRLERSSM